MNKQFLKKYLKFKRLYKTMYQRKLVMLEFKQLFLSTFVLYKIEKIF